MNAKELTASLIDWIMAEKYFLPEILACEVPYVDSQRKVDLLAINDGYTVAFEVKSSRDNLQKIDDQILDYHQCFDMVYVVADIKFFPTLVKRLPKRTGIIANDSGRFSVRRVAIVRKRLNKKYLVSLLDKKSLEDFLGYRASEGRKMLIADLRKEVVAMGGMSELRGVVIEYLKSKFSDRYNRFINERGDETHADDLLFLSRRNSLYLEKLL